MSYPVGTPHRRRGTRSIGATRRGLARRSSTALRQACPWQVEHLSHLPAFAVPDRGEHRHVRARRPCLSVRLCGVRSDRRRCVGDGGISPIRASSYISRGLAGPPSNRPVGAAALRRRIGNYHSVGAHRRRRPGVRSAASCTAPGGEGRARRFSLVSAFLSASLIGSEAPPIDQVVAAWRVRC